MFVFSIIPVSEVADFFDVLVFALMRHSVPKRCPSFYSFFPIILLRLFGLVIVINSVSNPKRILFLRFHTGQLADVLYSQDVGQVFHTASLRTIFMMTLLSDIESDRGVTVFTPWTLTDLIGVTVQTIGKTSGNKMICVC